MSGQNTHKQIVAMVILMFLGVASLGAYVWFDDGRRAEAEDQHLLEATHRGAKLYANNCRVCHGNAGEGLIGLALNTPENTLAFRSYNNAALDELQARFRGTIECGRNGTAMPPWAVAHGGSMNFFHIENLVTLITTNAGNAWEEAAHLAVEQDELTLAGLEDALELAKQGIRASSVADVVNAAIERADGDVGVALEAALLQLTREGIAAQIEAEFGEALAAAEAAEDDDAIAALDAEIVVREAALLEEGIADALNASDGDPEVALIRAQHALADNALRNARDTLDTAVAKFEAGRPIQDAPTPLELTRGTCGQR
jgi:mono/diheme cytochrome c family protein